MSIDTRVIADFNTLDAADWAALDHDDNPFLSHAFLGALEASGSVSPEAGWQPQHLALYEDGKLAAFAPAYVKSHSHGEFVFDWSWADAYRRHGLAYYPKLLTGVPYSPVTGPRLLVRRGHPEKEQLKQALAGLAADLCERLELSSWHCNFTRAQDSEVLQRTELLQRGDWQFHWFNQGYTDFEQFLRQLRSRKRKNIRKERRQVADAGIDFEWLRGDELDTAAIDFVYHCYVNTFRAYGNLPALNRDFFGRAARSLGNRLRVAIARRGEQPLAMSLFLAGGGRLYGRYWGCVEAIPGLHFEAAYYQGIELCIREGIAVFEPGAQGEHKVSRGFVPVKTRSFHLVRDARFRAAIAQYLEREAGWLDEYRGELATHEPFRRDLP
ncbi:MAG: GNAT family N-acetyltransferase [Xanthomonadales bacterium]|nr:GNAT family N-acetyltransferase [Xanthomonadales bacterium]